MSMILGRAMVCVASLASLVAAAGCISVKGSYERPPTGSIPSGDAGDPDGDATEMTEAGGSGPDRAVAGNSCYPRVIRAVAVDQFAEAHTAPPTCAIDDAGVLTMTYTAQPGCAVYAGPGGSSSPYRACHFAQNEDLSDFYRNKGMIEARYCVTGPLFDAVDVWLDRESSDPTLDGMALRAMQLQAPELPMSNAAPTTTCRTVAFSLGESCGGLSNCGASCVDGDSGGVGGAGGSGSPPGASDAAPLASCAALERVKLRLTTEYCPADCTESTCVRPNPVQLRLLSFTYYPEDCRCVSDAECAAGSFCRKDGIPPSAACWNTGGCRGICE